MPDHICTFSRGNWLWKPANLKDQTTVPQFILIKFEAPWQCAILCFLFKNWLNKINATFLLVKKKKNNSNNKQTNKQKSKMIGISLNVVHRHAWKGWQKHTTERSDRLYNHFSFHIRCVSFVNTCCTTGRTEKFDYSIILFPGFSLLPRERTLVAAGHVTFCDNGFLIGVGFLKTLELWSSKANWCFRFSLPSVISADLLGNGVYVLSHPWGSLRQNHCESHVNSSNQGSFSR